MHLPAEIHAVKMLLLLQHVWLLSEADAAASVTAP